MRLLVVEDDVKTARALAAGLERAGFSVATAHTGEDGFFLLNAELFDLVVLDWMLPARSGIEIFKTLRSRGNKTPVLLLTARDAVDDRVLGLESGADDYLVKPFALEKIVRTNQLIDRLLLLTRSDNSEIPLQMEAGLVRPVLVEVNDALSLVAGEKQRPLQSDAPINCWRSSIPRCFAWPSCLCCRSPISSPTCLTPKPLN